MPSHSQCPATGTSAAFQAAPGAGCHGTSPADIQHGEKRTRMRKSLVPGATWSWWLRTVQFHGTFKSWLIYCGQTLGVGLFRDWAGADAPDSRWDEYRGW